MQRVSGRIAVVMGILLGATTASAADKGLVLHLPFDGNLEPAVGKDVGPVRAKGDPRFVQGRFGQAVSLTDGAHLIVPVPPAIKKGEFSISFWVKPLWHPNDNLPHTFLYIPDRPEKTDAVGWAPGQLMVSKGWSEAITPNYFYGVTHSDVARRHLRPGQWTHFLVEYSVSSGFTAGYVNGEGSRRPLSPPAPPTAHGEVLWLGARADNPETGAFGDLVLDELKVYDRVVEPSEIPAVAGAAFPPPFDDLSVGNAFDMAKAVETPHVAWAKPLAGGPVKLLCLTEGRRAREIAELAQRVDLEPTVLTTPSASPHLVKANPEVYAALGRRVEERLKAGPVHVILVAAFGWNLVPESARAAMMGAVDKGAGLVLVDPQCIGVGPGPGRDRVMWDGLWGGWAETPEGAAIERLVGRLDRPDEDYLLKPIPWPAVALFGPTLKTRPPASFFRGGRLGQGRVLIYDIHCGSYYYPGCLTPSTLWVGPLAFDEFDYDYAIAAAAKAVLWAAGRDPAVRLEGVAFRPSRSASPPIGVGTAGQWAIDLRNASPAEARVTVKLTARTRSPDPPFQAEQAVTLKPGATRLQFPQTLESVGLTCADVRLLQDGRVLDWFTGTVEARPGNPWLVELAADRPFYGDGQAPRVRARFALKKYAYVTGETAELRWRLYDSYGRLIARGTQVCVCNPSDEEATETSWTLQPLEPASLGYRLIADLAYRGKVTDRRAIDLWRTRDDIDDYFLGSWQGGGTPVDRLATLVMRDRYGLSCGGATAGGGPVDESFELSLQWLARQDLRPWVMATDIGRGADAQKRRVPDLADPLWRAGLRKRLAQVAQVARPYSPLFYSLGDETKVGPPDYRASGFEEEAFRTALKARYGTIEKLNAAWETKYADWTQIAIPPPEANDWKTGSPLLGALADFRETLYADALAIGTEGSQSTHPGARTGVEGIFGLTQAWTGQDYWKMAQRSTFLGQYALGMEMNMIRSFQKPGDLLGAWYNYTKLDREYSLYGPWQVLLRGGRAFLWYTTLEGSEYTALNPDFSPYTQFQWTNEELQPLLTGIGKLVVGLERDDLGVAILYHQRNLDRCSPQFHSAMVTASLLEDLGLQHDWIHGDQIKAGALRSRRLKVLFLPGQFHMEPEVAAAIRAYVNAGGALVADVLPAEADGIRRYKARPLDDLFADARQMKGAMPPASEDDVKTWSSRIKSVGQGRTLLYGAYPSSYHRDRLKARGAFLRDAVGRFLSASGVKPAATVQPTDGSFQPRVVVTYHDGEALYVATQREYGVPDLSPREFEFAAPAKAHAYDVRAGQYLGETNKARLTLEVARGALVAFLPYQAKAVMIRGLPEQVAGGETVRVQLAMVWEGGRPAHGVFRVEVRNPAGQPVRPLCRKVRWTGGQAVLPLRLAYNDPAGQWTLSVTDVATGVWAEARFRVE